LAAPGGWAIPHRLGVGVIFFHAGGTERQDDGGASKQRRPEGGSVRPPSSIFGKGMTLIPTGKRLRGSFGAAALYSVFYAGAHAIWIKHGRFADLGYEGV